MFFKIAPDSVIGRTCATRTYPRSRWIPVVMLVWAVWLVVTPVLADNRGWLWPTVASLAAFLVLYFRAYYGPASQILWCALGMAALAFALTPINDGAYCYIIYACAFLAFSGSARVALVRMLALNIIYSLNMWWLHVPWGFIGSSMLVGMAVGAMNVLFRRNQDQDAELRLSHDEIRRLAASAERERIGRDLHDLLGHTLSMVALKSELARRLIERDPRAARREIEDVEKVAREALSQVRNAVSGIRAAALVSELASARLLLEAAGVRMEYSRDEVELPSDIETCLALILREAVTNIQRHARANRVEVGVSASAGSVVMHIRDDGRGGVSTRGNGLTGMRERVQAMDGRLSIDSPRDGGTSIKVSLPLPTPAAPEAKPATISPPAHLSLPGRAGSLA